MVKTDFCVLLCAVVVLKILFTKGSGLHWVQRRNLNHGMPRIMCVFSVRSDPVLVLVLSKRISLGCLTLGHVWKPSCIVLCSTLGFGADMEVALLADPSLVAGTAVIPWDRSLLPTEPWWHFPGRRAAVSQALQRFSTHHSNVFQLCTARTEVQSI